MTPDERRAYVKRLVDEMPPLTPEQRTELRELLRPGVAAAQAAAKQKAEKAA